jgi:hypothetical protein
MSTQPRDRASARAEARRRARLAARGELPDDQAGEGEAAETAPARGGGLLGRLFPPAPPLPNRPAPLEGFDESGSLRPIRVRAFLLRRNLLAWLLPGLAAGAGFFGSIYFGRDATLSLISTFVLFGALIAAGWFGWQRPALYGTAAALLGYLLAVAVVLGSFATLGITPAEFGGQVASLIVQGIYQAALGFLGGWYGGYLRRRQTHLSGDRARASRRR